MHSLDMLTKVERGERERKKKKTEKRRRLSKVQRERERRISSYSRPAGNVSLKQALHFPIYPFVISYGNFQNSKIAQFA